MLTSKPIYIPLGIGIFDLFQSARVLFKHEVIHPFTISCLIICIAQTVDNGTWTYDINSDGTSITLTGCSNRDCPSKT